MDNFKITSINPSGSYHIYGEVLIKLMKECAKIAIQEVNEAGEQKEDKLYTTDEAMVYLRVKSRATMHKYIKKYNLPYISGNPSMFKESDLKKLLEQKYIR